jgi:hypothetical protein
LFKRSARLRLLAAPAVASVAFWSLNAAALPVGVGNSVEARKALEFAGCAGVGIKGSEEKGGRIFC